MATGRDKRSGMVYHARDRLLKRRLQEWEEECARASLPQSTTMGKCNAKRAKKKD